MSPAAPRPTLFPVDNVVNGRSSMEKRPPANTTHKKESVGYASDSTSSSTGSQASRSAKEELPTAFDSSSLTSSASSSTQASSSSPFTARPSSVASFGSNGPTLAAASSSHSNLSASLLTPTLASALGITPSARRKRHALKQQIAQTPPSSSISFSSLGSAWSRRPSLPVLSSSENNRISMFSVASFESLPEGEDIVTGLVSSPKLPKNTNTIQTSAVPPLSVQPLEFEPQRRLPRRERRETAPIEPSDPIWAKRRNIVAELLETERVFVQSLRVINDHYYQPLLAFSRGAPPASAPEIPANASPALSRKAVNEIFSNFTDIFHLNSELLVCLEDRLSGRSRSSPNSRPVSMVAPIRSSNEQGEHAWDAQSDLIGDILAPMAPFLKMYSFYVKNFSSALTRIEGERKSNEVFARFLKETERITWMTTSAGHATGFGFGLGLQAHLLTIVQRIPRYKLLVGELIKCTPSTHNDYLDLCRANKVIEQVAESINDNIRQHEMVLSMLNIQRLLVGMPVRLIVPGRALLKRATLLKAGRKDIHAREFFLFTDCIIYAAPPAGPMVDATAAWQAFSRYGACGGELSSGTGVSSDSTSGRPPSPTKRVHDGIRRRTTSVPTHIDPKRVSFSSLEGQQLQYRGKYALQDCTVLGVDDATSNDPALRHSFEIHTPGKSFAVYAESLDAKEEWLSAIRSAREELMSNRRTLHADEDSILAKRDRRRSLQAFHKNIVYPQSVNESSASTIPEGATVDEQSKQSRSRRESFPTSFSTAASLALYLGGGGGGTTPLTPAASMRGQLKVLEDYNAPVWVPDSRADKCACCSESFGLWRRKHHCRLCGQVVCWSCSQRSFLIAGDEEGDSDRPARSCDSCYESVFPDTPEGSIAGVDGSHSGSGNTTAQGNKAFDSDVSLPSCPPTPTTPNTTLSVVTSDGRVVSSTGVMSGGEQPQRGEMGEAGDTSMPLPRMRRHHSVSPPGASIPNAPAARIAKAHALDPRLYHGQLLSPQVHAATSGAGTFRLVTPRLTTPEGERPPLVRSARTHGGRLGSGDDDRQNGDKASGPDRDPRQRPSDESGDYFSGVPLGRSQLLHDSSSSSSSPSSTPFPSFLAPRRRKPMSAAARLSSVYSALAPASSPSSGPRP